MTTLAPPKIFKTPYTVPSPQQIIQPALEERRKVVEQGKGLRDKLRAIGESGGD